MRTRARTSRTGPSSYEVSAPRCAQATSCSISLAATAVWPTYLPEQRYVGVDASEEMVAAGREQGRELVHADLNDYAPTAPVQATTIFRAIYYARDRRELFDAHRGLHGAEARVRPQPAPVSAGGRARPISGRPASTCSRRGRSSCRRRVLLPLLTLLERAPLLARVLLRYRFTLLCSASRRAEAS